MNKTDNILAHIVIKGIERVLHKSAMDRSPNPHFLSTLSIKATEGVNQYTGGKLPTICFSSVFCHRVQQVIYARSMKVLNIANYVLPEQDSFSLVDLLAVEAIHLYSKFLKHVQKSSKDSLELAKIITGKPIYHELHAYIQTMINRYGLNNTFSNNVLEITPIPIDQYIAGDEVTFRYENGLSTGVIIRVLNKGLKVLLSNSETITVSPHAVV
jgi:hypothetical protein